MLLRQSRRLLISRSTWKPYRSLSTTVSDSLGPKLDQNPLNVEPVQTNPSFNDILSKAHEQMNSDTPILVDAIVKSSIDPPLSDFGYTPTHLVIKLLVHTHDLTGLPWWTTIMIITAGIRLSLFPMHIRTQKEVMKMVNAKDELQQVQEEIKNSTFMSSQERAEKLGAVYKKHQLNPFRPFVPILVSIPVFISFFIGLRTCAEQFPSFKTGGTLWFTDLSLPDTTYTFPMMTCGFFILTLYLGGESQENNQMTKTMKQIFAASSVLIIPLTAYMPQAVFVYWTTTNMFSLTQTLLFKFPQTRAIFGLPPIPRPNSASVIPVSGGSKPNFATLANAATAIKPPVVTSSPLQEETTTKPTPLNNQEIIEEIRRRRQKRRGA